VITFGAPAAHALGFKKGGAKSIRLALEEQLAIEKKKDKEITNGDGNADDDEKEEAEDPIFAKFLEQGLILRKHHALGNMSSQKKGNTIIVITSNDSVHAAETEGEPTRVVKDAMELLQLRYHEIYGQLSRLVVNTNPVSKKTLQQIAHEREELQKNMKSLFDMVENFRYWAPGEEEGPKVLAEVLKDATMVLFEKSLTELLEVAPRRPSAEEAGEETTINLPVSADDGTGNVVPLENYTVWEDKLDRFPPFSSPFTPRHCFIFFPWSLAWPPRKTFW